jgi:hypothetical protein
MSAVHRTRSLSTLVQEIEVMSQGATAPAKPTTVVDDFGVLHIIRHPVRVVISEPDQHIMSELHSLLIDLVGLSFGDFS